MCKLKSLLLYIVLTFLICYSHAQPKRRKSPNRPIIQEEQTVPIPESIQTQETKKEGISEQPPSFQNPEQQQQEVDLDPVDEEKMLMKEWEEYMSDFTPSDLITFEVKARTEETYYEDIQTVPSNIRGA